MVLRSFTPAQANRTLTLVRRIVADILEKGRELRSVADSTRDVASTRRHLEQLGNDMRMLIEELTQIGCEYKDWSFDVGLVDFPSVIDGKRVLLCWRSDEPRIEWYHGYEDGYAGRHRIPEKLLEAEIEEATQKRSP